MSDFKRVVFEDWSLWVPMVSFGIFFTVFVMVSVRAMFLGKSERERLAAMPIEESQDPSQP